MDVLTAQRAEREITMAIADVATKYLGFLRDHVEAWRAGEIDYVTFIKLQQSTWSTIRAEDAAVSATVVHALLEVKDTAVVGWINAGREPALQRPVRPPAAARFHNRRYRVQSEPCENGNQLLRVTAPMPPAVMDHVALRARSAFIYELAAELERRSEELDVRWLIVPDVLDGQLTIAIGGRGEAPLAAEFASTFAVELGN
ncbi:MAG: hypothetical protein ABIY55_01500 [Kofleriaceae bacterium]